MYNIEGLYICHETSTTPYPDIQHNAFEHRCTGTVIEVLIPVKLDTLIDICIHLYRVAYN